MLQLGAAMRTPFKSVRTEQTHQRVAFFLEFKQEAGGGSLRG